MSGAAQAAAPDASGAREAYIYYRIPGEAELAWREQLLALHGELRSRHAGLRTGVLRRAHADGAEVTLMETYAFDAAPLAAHALDTLLAEVEARCAALPDRPEAPRHLEVFERCA